MATLVKRDLIGSNLFKTETTYGSKGERRVFVRLDPTDSFGSSTSIGRAIEKAIDGQYHHPDDETLPLKEASAIQVGKEAFEVTLEYKRSRSTGGALDIPGGQAVVSNWRTSLVPFKAHYTSESHHPRYKGVPTGGFVDHIDTTLTPADQVPSPTRAADETYFYSYDSKPWKKYRATNDETPPLPRIIYIPESDISVPAVLDKYQFARLQTEVLPVVGNLNANDITNFGGLGFAIGELKLVGVDTDWVNQRSLGAQGFVNELTFAVNYKFKFRQGGHIEEALFYERSTGYWDTRYDALGRYSVFENFPI